MRAPRPPPSCCPASPTRAGGARRSPTAWPTASSRSARWACSRRARSSTARTSASRLRTSAWPRASSPTSLPRCWVAESEDKLRLGGMALRNGLLVHGPTHWAAAVRKPDGEIAVASGAKPDLGGKATERVPGLRGVTKLAEAFAVIPIVKRALPEAKLPMQDAKTLGAMLGAAATAQAVRAAGPRTLFREAAVGVVSLAPALLALRGGELASYHGVEHKAIAGYEQDRDATAVDKEHARGASTLVPPITPAPAAGSVAARRVGLKGPA